MTKPPKLGRPPRAKRAMTDDNRIQLRVTADERRTWLAFAAKQSLGLSDMIREAVETAIARGSTR